MKLKTVEAVVLIKYMSIDKTLVSIGGLALVAFIYWFFFGKKEEEGKVSDNVEILVSGGFSPSVVKIKNGQKTKISLLRTEDNSCLEEFIISDFKIKEYLPLNKKVEIEITPTKRGEYRFNCGMGMFHGKVVVE